MIVTSLRWALTVWLLYNMWTGHTWALYWLVTLGIVATEVVNAAVGRLFVRTQVLIRWLSNVVGKDDA